MTASHIIEGKYMHMCMHNMYFIHDEYVHMCHCICRYKYYVYYFLYYRFVGILYDELYIKEDLVYDRHASQLIGFVNLGAVDQQLATLETAASKSTPAIATCILTLMVRGIFYSLQFPLVNFATVGLKGISRHHVGGSGAPGAQ